MAVKINNRLTALQTELENRGCYIIEREFISPNIKAIYCDKCIAINKIVTDENEKLCLITEQLAHDYLSSGIVLNDKKQIARAKAWAYDRLVGLSGIIETYENGAETPSDIAEQLEITEKFFNEAIIYYSKKYGKAVSVGDITIKFSPSFKIQSIKKADNAD